MFFMPLRDATRAVGLVCVVVFSPMSILLGQAPTQFLALAVPPPNVGTCLDISHGNVRVNGRLAQSRLMLSNRAPAASRDVFVARDSAGHLTAFSDESNVMVHPLVKAVERINAKLLRDGRVVGTLERSRIAYADSNVFRDNVDIQRLAATTHVATSSEELDAAAQQKIRVLVTWLIKRCPA
jgi:hypothetical protein